MAPIISENSNGRAKKDEGDVRTRPLQDLNHSQSLAASTAHRSLPITAHTIATNHQMNGGQKNVRPRPSGRVLGKYPLSPGANALSLEVKLIPGALAPEGDLSTS